MATAHEESKPSYLPQHPSSRNLRWQAPPEDVFKVNADMALSVEKNSVGIGIMMRDLVSMFIASKTMEILSCSSPHRAELVTAKEVLIFA